MTRAQIAKELRDRALYSKDGFLTFKQAFGAVGSAFIETHEEDEFISTLTHIERRMFFLFVAESLS